MKKIFSVLIVICIIFSSVSVVSAAGLVLQKDLDVFAGAVTNMISEYEQNASDESVFFTASDDEEENKDTNRLIVKSSVKIDTLDAIDYVSGYNNLHILQFADDASCDEAYSYYSSLTCVDFVQEDEYVYEDTIEDETPVFEEAAIDITSQYPSDLFGYTDAKANMASGEVVVAVVDSGVANDHEFLAGRVIPTGFDSINNVSCYDDRGHGTHVAGIIVANTKSNVKIKPYKVLSAKGEGTDTQVYLGIAAAVEDGVDIINLSLTRKGESEVIHEGVTEAYNSGITVVAAAGNNNVDLGSHFYSPACFDEVICAVSIGTNKYKASTSNWGSDRDLSAPGVDILSTYLNNTYKIQSGTSMAAPFLSCCAAYLLADSYYSPDSLFETLKLRTKAGGGTHDIRYVCPGTLVKVTSTCSAPVFTYSAGEFCGYLDVKLSCPTAGATIMYRTSDMNSTEFYEYKNPIRITDTTSFYAYAFCKNYKNSTSTSITYTKSTIDASAFQLNENDVLVGYNGTDSDVVVPAYFNGGCAIKVASSAFSGNKNITSVTFSQYLTTIGEGAFKDCSNLKSITATGVTTVEADAFNGCYLLESFTFDNVTDIGEKAFLNCLSLASVTAKNLKTIGLRAFENSAVTDFKAQNATSIGDNAFYGSKLINATLTYTETVGANAFAYCENLSTVTLTNATTIGDSAFIGCDGLYTITLPKVTTLGNNVFKNCTSLITVTANAVNEICDYTFYGCSALNTLNFSALTTIGDYAFANSGIKKILLPKVTSLGSKAFGNCLSLSSVTLAGLTSFVSDSFVGCVNVETLSVNNATEFDFAGGTLAECFPKLNDFSDTAAKFTVIPDNFFDGCSKLTTVTFKNIYTVGNYAFRGTGLTKINLPSATTIGTGAFSNMTSLETVNLSQPQTIDFSAFSGSKNVKSFVMARLEKLPVGFKCYNIFPNIEFFNCDSLIDVPDYAFKGCENLYYFDFFKIESVGIESFCGTAVNDPYFSQALTVGERAFADCTNLGNVSMTGLSGIDGGFNLNIFENSEHTVTHLNLNGLYLTNTEELEQLNFQKFVNLQEVGLNKQPIIPADAFKGCSVLSKVVLGNCTTIGENAFADCTSLATVTLPLCEVIGSGAFSGCTALESFSADAVESFDFDTFDGCSSIETLSFNSVLEFPLDEEGRFQLSGLERLESFSADSVEVVPDNFLKNCKSLKSVSFKNAWEIGDYAFYNTSLSTIDIGSPDIIGDYSFYGTDITTLTLSNVSSIGAYAFSDCDLLDSITVNSNGAIGEGAFSNCDEVTSIIFNNITSLPVNVISGCPNVTYLDIGQVAELSVGSDGSSYVSDKPLLVDFYAEYVEHIPDSYFINNPLLQTASISAAVSVGDKAFMNTDLREIPFYNTLSIGDYAFYGTELTEAQLDVATDIGDYAFAECAYLTSFVVYTDFSEVNLGIGVCENDTALARAAIYGTDIEIPDGFFKNCSKLSRLYATADWRKTGNYANIISVGDEALYGCKGLTLESIKIADIQKLGKNALAGLSNTSNAISKYYNLPNLINIDEGAFGDLEVSSLALENVEIVRDLPICDYVAIGSDIKEFSTVDTDTVIYAYEDSVVDNFCAENGLNFKKYNEEELILCDVAPVLKGYDDALYFDIVGFNTTYKWYACNNPDRSDAVEIQTTADEPNVIDPIALFFDNYEENKYTYFYCVATSTENGNVLEVTSALSKNIFATIKGTEDTFIDFYECIIFTHSLDNVNTLDNIFAVDGEIEVTPSYSAGDCNCYGTGSTVNILNDGEVALTQTLIVYGDVNGDGVVDVLDVTELEKASNGRDNCTNDDLNYKSAADIDGSSSIDVADYQAVVNKALS